MPITKVWPSLHQFSQTHQCSTALHNIYKISPNQTISAESRNEFTAQRKV